jgi:hypothetical protein
MLVNWPINPFYVSTNAFLQDAVEGSSISGSSSNFFTNLEGYDFYCLIEFLTSVWNVEASVSRGRGKRPPEQIHSLQSGSTHIRLGFAEKTLLSYHMHAHFLDQYKVSCFKIFY